MKKITLFISASLLLMKSLYGQNYGEVIYPHSNGGTKMCSAFTTVQHTNNPGYLMAGYQPVSAAGGFNFVIDRTALGGSFGGPHTFQKAYQIYANMNEECNFRILPVKNCAGISVIETNGPAVSPFPSSPPISYAIAGAFSHGCFFSIMDLYGNCLLSTSFVFPNPPYFRVSKPIIMESDNIKGEYIVSGSIDNLMYAFRITASGQVLWNHYYPIVGEPRDMVASAFGSRHEIILVGKTGIDSLNYGNDGFIMKISEVNGNVAVFKRIHVYAMWPFPIGEQYFNTISVVQKEYPSNFHGEGYAVGGYCEPTGGSNLGRAWYYRCDTDLVMHVSFIYSPHADPLGGEVVDITSRKRINSPKYDYYALLKTNAGMDVLVLDDRTLSLANGPVIREYLYNIPGQVSESCQLGVYNDITSPNAGLQIFGTDNVANPGAHYAVKAYFSGESGCHFTYFNPGECASATSHFQDTIVPFGGLTQCPNFAIVSTENPGFMEICGPVDNISDNSNARQYLNTGNLVSSGSNKISVFPNPSDQHSQVQYSLSENSTVKLELYNTLGEHVTVLEDDTRNAGTYTSEIDFIKLGLKEGVYILRLNLNGEVSTKSVIFQGQ